MIGMWTSNAYFASKYWHNEQRKFLDYVQALSVALMTNTIDGDERKCVSPAPSSSSTTSECACVVTALKNIGWSGSPQLCCAVCGERTTVACSVCSRKDCVVPLCKPERELKGAIIKTSCLRIHRRNPEVQRRACPRTKKKEKMAGMKRRRTAHLGDDEGSDEEE